MLSINKKQYKARFVNNREDKTSFKNSHCLLIISVFDQANTYGDKFSAIIEKINKNFSECTILLADSLNRHTFKLYNPNKTHLETYNQSLEYGSNWIESNRHYLKKMTIPYQVTRWDKWLKHSNYESIKTLIDELYEINPKFRINVLESIKEYLLRLDKNGLTFNCPNAFKLSSEYIKEECAAIMIMASYGYNHALYQGNEPKAFQYIRQTFIEPFYGRCLNWLQYELKSKN